MKKIITALGSMFMLLFALVACSAALATETPAEAPTVSASPAPVETTEAPAPVETTEAPIEEPKVIEPEITVSQENAIESAESYVDIMAFSRSGLIKQLKYEGYSKADATFAVDYIEVDWMAEAAESAESYVDLMAFSRSGLIDQLEYEGFTEKQARHGADSVGL